VVHQKDDAMGDRLEDANMAWPIHSGRDKQSRAGQGRTGDRLDRALRNRHRVWATAVRAVGQNRAGATDTPSSDDPRLGVARRVFLNDDAGDGNGYRGVANAQAKRHAAEERNGAFGFWLRHVRYRTATCPRVCFTPEAGILRKGRVNPLCATSGHIEPQ
jgi:hypothetical protein